MTEPFDYKLCWAHPQYPGNLFEKCSNATSCLHGSPECQRDCVYYARCKRAFELAGLPNKYWYVPSKPISYDIDVGALRLLKRIRQQVKSFVDTGQSLLIHSDNLGNGKTLRSVILANTYIHLNVENKYSDKLVRYVYVPKFVADNEVVEKLNYDSESRKQYYNTLLDLAESSLVIWDGIGFGSKTRLEDVVLRSCIQSRINNESSNIFIAYGNLQFLKDSIEKRDFDRILNNAIEVEFKGPNFKHPEDFIY